MCPVTGANFDKPSYRKFAAGYYLTKIAMQWFWNCYTSSLSERMEIYASPLRAMTEELRGLPPAPI